MKRPFLLHCDEICYQIDAPHIRIVWEWESKCLWLFDWTVSFHLFNFSTIITIRYVVEGSFVEHYLVTTPTLKQSFRFGLEVSKLGIGEQVLFNFSTIITIIRYVFKGSFVEHYLFWQGSNLDSTSLKNKEKLSISCKLQLFGKYIYIYISH